MISPEDSADVFYDIDLPLGGVSDMLFIDLSYSHLFAFSNRGMVTQNFNQY